MTATAYVQTSETGHIARPAVIRAVAMDPEGQVRVLDRGDGVARVPIEAGLRDCVQAVRDGPTRA